MGTAGIDGLSVWANWNPDGGFHIEGLHLGAGRIVGKEDYEYHITVAKEDLPKLAAALGCAEDAILQTFTAQLDAIVTAGERRWLTEHDVPNSLWVA
ncbi:MAG: hypothetical protein ABI566_04700 [Pseudolysinimonas sp.]